MDNLRLPHTSAGTPYSINVLLPSEKEKKKSDILTFTSTSDLSQVKPTNKEREKRRLLKDSVNGVIDGCGGANL